MARLLVAYRLVSFMEFLQKLAAGAVGNFDASLITIGVLVAVAWQCLGLAWSRQWFLLPLAIGLSGLGAFLLNPVADSTSLVDLQSFLSRGEFPFLICSLQMLVAGITVWIVIKSRAEPTQEWWRLAIGALHCLPSPLVLAGVLLLQQQWLSLEAGARPEGIGLIVALSLAGLLVLTVCVAMALSPMLRTKLYLLVSLMLLSLAALLTALESSLPSSNSATDWQKSLTEIGIGAAVVFVFLVVGYGIEANSQRSIRTVGLAKREPT